MNKKIGIAQTQYKVYGSLDLMSRYSKDNDIHDTIMNKLVDLYDAVTDIRAKLEHPRPTP
jgi:hypothetical protein